MGLDNMILTVTPNPSVDHTLFVDGFIAGTTNRALGVERDAGGKGISVSRVLTSLHTPTLATGFLGGGTGAYVRHTLEEEGVPYDFVKIHGETRINFEVQDVSGKPPTCFNEPGPLIDAADVDALLRHIRKHLSDASWLVLAGSLPPGVSDDLFAELGSEATRTGKPFAVDADGTVLRLAVRAGPCFVKPNNAEAGKLLNRSVATDLEAVNAVMELRRRMLESNSPPNAVAVISRGIEGAVMADSEGVWIGRTPVVEVNSTVGSGDSMVAAMLSALVNGLSPQDALLQGMAAGAATAEMKGCGLATEADIQRLLPAARVSIATVLPVLAP